MAPIMHPKDYRPSLILDTTQRCNYRCSMCFWSNPEVARQLEQEDPLMPSEVFRQALESAVPHCSTLGLAGGGEFLADPLLSERLPALNETLLRHPEVRFYQTTNGALLTAERLSFLKGVKQVGFIVSIDSTDALTYAAIRRPGTLSKVLANLRALRPNLYALGVRDVHLQLNVVAMKRNLLTLPDVLRFAQEIQAAVFVEHPQGFGPEDLPKESLFHHPAFTNRFMGRLTELARALDVPFYTPPPFAITPEEVAASLASSRDGLRSCSQLDRTGPIQILPNGDVAVCCQGLVFGNLREQSFESIFYSPRFDEYRDAIAQGRPKSPCDHCRHLHRQAPYLYDAAVYDMDIPPEVRNLDPNPDLQAEGFFDWLDELTEAQLRRQLRQDYAARAKLVTDPEPWPDLAAGLRDREISDKLTGFIRARTRLVVYPAGGQADWLMKHSLLSLAEVVGFSDRNPDRQGTSFHGHPVVAPEEIASLKPEALVVASDAFRIEILRSLAPWEAKGIPVISLPNRSAAS